MAAPDYDYDQCRATLEPQWPEGLDKVRCVLPAGHREHHLVYDAEHDVTCKWKGQMATVWKANLDVEFPSGHQTW
jgi:hypothetical protein